MSIEQKIAELMRESAEFTEIVEDAPTGLPKQASALGQEGSHLPAAPTDENPDNKVAHDSEVSDKEKEDALAALKKKTLTKEDLALDMATDVAALVEGENLSEEFKAKAATIFEAAVLSRVSAEVAKLDEQYSASFDTQLEEAVATEVEGLIEQVDGYLGYIAEQWMKDNEIALESGLKAEILEGFVTGLKGLFEEHYIDVPEGATDIVTEMETIVSEKEQEVQSLAEKLNESEQRNIELTKTLANKVRADLIEAKCGGLADTDAEKFKGLASELIFENAENFDKKLTVIRENYFDKRVAEPVGASFLTEGAPVVDEKVLSANMNAYTRALSI